MILVRNACVFARGRRCAQLPVVHIFTIGFDYSVRWMNGNEVRMLTLDEARCWKVSPRAVNFRLLLLPKMSVIYYYITSSDQK